MDYLKIKGAAAMRGLVAASIWASLGLRVIVMDSDPSIRALFACAALVLVGFALGSATWIVTAPKRAKRPLTDAVVLAEMKAPFAMLGIMLIGSAIVRMSLSRYSFGNRPTGGDRVQQSNTDQQMSFRNR